MIVVAFVIKFNLHYTEEPFKIFVLKQIVHDTQHELAR